MATLPEGFEVEPTALTLPEGFEIEPTESFIGAGVIEPVRAVGSALVRTIGGGLAGAAQAISPFAEPGAGAETVKEFQENIFKPETPEGQENLKLFGELVQKGVDIVNFPISGIGGLLSLVSGEGIDKAAETVKNIQEKGVSKVLGETTFEKTGDPLAATIAETFPTFIGELVGLKGAGKVVEGAGRLAEGAGRVAERLPTQVVEGAARAIEAVIPITESAKEIAKGIFEFQTPTKQRIAQAIEEGSTDVETARFLLEPAKKVISDKPRTKIQEFLDIGGPKVKTDKVAVEAIDQGFDEGVVAAIKGANPVDKAKMLEMVDIMEKGKKNTLFAAKNRPSDVAGNILMERFQSVFDANKTAGKELDSVANAMRGKTVDFDPAINSFIDDLDSLGVTLTNELKPIFSGSVIEGIPGAEKIITQIINRMKNIKSPDGKKLHDLKKFIDEQVTFGKRTEGLSGRTENVLKKLRRNIDGLLDNQFPEYDRVNTVFSETISAIDSLQDVAGRKMDLSGPNAQKATGTLLRRLMSNAQSRVNLLDAVNEIEAAAFKHGAGKIPKLPGESPGRADLLTQILFADELDSVFGPVARTSFQGDIGKAIKKGVEGISTKTGAIDIGLIAVEKISEKTRGINQEGAFKSIKELLKQGKKL